MTTAVRHLYVSHPQVVIDPTVAVPSWGLSEQGGIRARAFAELPWIKQFPRVVSSDEPKAIQTAEIIASALGVDAEIRAGMHENDRSATGFLPPTEFSETADAFFASPDMSVRGWERAIDAQSRIVGAVGAAISEKPMTRTIFVGHGGVGTLLQCHCASWPIARRYDQPDGGGCHFAFSLASRIVLYRWRPMEAEPAL